MVRFTNDQIGNNHQHEKTFSASVNFADSFVDSRSQQTYHDFSATVAIGEITQEGAMVGVYSLLNAVH